MRLHDAYVLRLFVRVMIFSVVGFAVVFLLADLFEKMDDYIDNQAKLGSVVQLYAYMLPDIVRLTLPVDLLLATIFTLGVLGRNNEIVALLSSGVSMLRIALPILVCALLAVGLSVLLSESIVPETNARMLRIKRVEIEKRAPLDAPVRHDFTYRGEGGYLWYVRLFNVEARRMTDIVVHQYRAGRMVARLDARSAEWRDGWWEFQDGYYRTFSPEAPAGVTMQGATAADSLGPAPELAAAGERAESFHTLRLPDLQESPEDLARLEPEPEAMNFRQLRRYVEKVRASGGQVNDYLVDMYVKLSYPFTSLVMTILGIGLSASKRKTSLATGFGLTLVIAFGYLAVSDLSAALGKNEALPPMLAAWLGPALFGIAGLFFLTRVNR
jgi:lipopolysaccharide export system permease protein